MAGLVIAQASAATPVTVAEAKAFARIDHDVEDSLVEMLIKSSVKLIEDYIHGAVVAQSWDYFLDSWWCGELELPLPPLISVGSVAYYDVDGVEQVADASLYQVLTAGDRGRIKLAVGQSWPALECGRMGAVRIRFRAGYAEAADVEDDVPEPIREATLKLVAVKYKYRDEAPAQEFASAKLIDMILSELDGYRSLRE